MSNSEKYNGQYAVKITLAESAYNNKEFNDEIKKGRLESIIFENIGFLKIYKGLPAEYQNVAVIDNYENALNLMKRVMDLPYIKEVSISKDGLRTGSERYIPVDY
ncbi:MAG: hypothetical protein WC812_02140 [Candidatus Pacearchaeota archaeon]|jgi:hypothetical protein